MFRVPQPAVVIQAADLPWLYRMDYTPPPIPSTAGLDAVIAAALSPFVSRPGVAAPTRLTSLVISAHGQAGQIGLGREHIHAGNVRAFADAIANRFKSIFILSCNVARIQATEVPYFNHPRWGPGAQPVRMRFLPGDGHHFCSLLAQRAHAEVHASTEPQAHGQNRLVFPEGWVDDYEGLYLVYGVSGRLIHQRRRPGFDDVASQNREFEGWSVRSHRNPQLPSDFHVLQGD